MNLYFISLIAGLSFMAAMIVTAVVTSRNQGDSKKQTLFLVGLVLIGCTLGGGAALVMIPAFEAMAHTHP